MIFSPKYFKRLNMDPRETEVVTIIEKLNTYHKFLEEKTYHNIEYINDFMKRIIEMYVDHNNVAMINLLRDTFPLCFTYACQLCCKTDNVDLFQSITDGNVDLIDISLFEFALNCGAHKIATNIQQHKHYDLSNNRKYLFVYCEKPCTQILDLILSDEHVDPSGKYNEALRSCCQLGLLDNIKSLIKHPRFVNNLNDKQVLFNILFYAQGNSDGFSMTFKHLEIEVIKLLLPLIQVDEWLVTKFGGYPDVLLLLDYGSEYMHA